MNAAAVASTLSHSAASSSSGAGVGASVFDVLLVSQLEAGLSRTLAGLVRDGVREISPAHAADVETWLPAIGAVAGLLMHSATLERQGATVFEALAGLSRAPIGRTAPQWKTASLLLAVSAPLARAALESSASAWRRQREDAEDGSGPASEPDPRMGHDVVANDDVVGSWAAVADSVASVAGGWLSKRVRGLLGGPASPETLRDAMPALVLSAFGTWEAGQLVAFGLGRSPYPTPLHWLAGCGLVLAGTGGGGGGGGGDGAAGGAQGGAAAPGGAGPGAGAAAGGTSTAVRWALWGARVSVILALAALQVGRWRAQQRERSGDGGDDDPPSHVQRRPMGTLARAPPPPKAVAEWLSRRSGDEGAREDAPAARGGRSERDWAPLEAGGVPMPAQDRVCPLTLRPLVEPCAAPSGVVYERVAIEAYSHRHGRCAVTGLPCGPSSLVRLFER